MYRERMMDDGYEHELVPCAGMRMGIGVKDRLA